MERRFLRNSRDKVLGGVCSGLALYVGADVTLVRLITLFGIIASGVLPGLLLYVICVIIVPLDIHAGGGYNAGGNEQGGYSGYETYQSNSYGPPSNNGRYVVGIGLIVVGVYLFARMFFGWLDFRYVFAGLLILGGLFMIFNSGRGKD